MRANASRPQPDDRERKLPAATDTAQQEIDPLLSEEPTVVRDDEQEVYDLGFIVEDRRENVAEEGLLTESLVESAQAERDEADFAERSDLDADPEVERADENDTGAGTASASVTLRGHAPGVAAGFGTEVPQDIGAEGFSVEENPLLLPAAELKYPISTDVLSDEARGVRNVDEMGSEAELNHLAERAVQMEQTGRE
jgi:hypothetical protein